MGEGCAAFLCTHTVIQNRFGIYPLVEGPGRQVHPRTTTFCLVLGFTPSGRPSRAHQSQNDFEQRYSGTSVDLPGPVSPPPVFLIYHIRKPRDRTHPVKLYHRAHILRLALIITIFDRQTNSRLNLKNHDIWSRISDTRFLI